MIVLSPTKTYYFIMNQILKGKKKKKLTPTKNSAYKIGLHFVIIILSISLSYLIFFNSFLLFGPFDGCLILSRINNCAGLGHRPHGPQVLYGARPQAPRALGLSLAIHYMTPPPFQTFSLDPDALGPGLGLRAEMRPHCLGYPK